MQSSKSEAQHQMTHTSRTYQEQNGRQLTCVFLPIDAHGHVNAMIGLADQLRARGHRTIFVCNDSSSPSHFGHELISTRTWQPPAGGQVGGSYLAANKQQQQVAAVESEEIVFMGDEGLNGKWAQMVDLLDLNVGKRDELVVESLTHNYSLLKLTIEAEIVAQDSTLEQILLYLAPDLTIVDQLSPIPAVHRLSQANYINRLAGTGKIWEPLRWATLASCNPLPLYYGHSAGRLPPPLMGLSVRQVPTGAWLEIEQLRWDRAIRESGMLAELQKLFGMAQIKGNLAAAGDGNDNDDNGEFLFKKFALNESNWLNIYMYPDKLDYAGERNVFLPGHLYLRTDCLIRQTNLPLPKNESSLGADEQLLDQVCEWRTSSSSSSGSGETSKANIIIYVSMGSTMSCNLTLMANLIKQVFECLRLNGSWRFLISLGSRSSQLPEILQKELDYWRRTGKLLTNKWWPQPELFRRKLVDVCVSHGGNNTLCELIHFKVAHLVIIGAFHDQLDNARRVAELGLGVSLSASQLAFAGWAEDGSGCGAADLLSDAVNRSLELEASLEPGQPVDAGLVKKELRDASYCARFIEQKVFKEISGGQPKQT